MTFTKTKIRLILSTAKGKQVKFLHLFQKYVFNTSVCFIIQLQVQKTWTYYISTIKQFFHKQRFFLDQGIFRQTKSFLQPKNFSARKTFSFIKGASHQKRFFLKQRFFLDQESFPQASILHANDTENIREKHLSFDTWW